VKETPEDELAQASRQILSALWSSDTLPLPLEVLIDSPTQIHWKALHALIRDDRLTREPEGIDFL
jgi:hypothetical protein